LASKSEDEQDKCEEPADQLMDLMAPEEAYNLDIERNDIEIRLRAL
jgi:hypothetical protein